MFAFGLFCPHLGVWELPWIFPKNIIPICNITQMRNLSFRIMILCVKLTYLLVLELPVQFHWRCLHTCSECLRLRGRIFNDKHYLTRASLVAQSVNLGSTCSAGDLGLIPGLGRSPGEGNGKPLEYPCLENLMDRGASWAAVHGVAKSQTRLSD